jgi:acetylornithine deacetylase/succinyl-diaminopimelate desuccinylase-like protein
MTHDDKARMHGNDERLEIAGLDFGVEFLYRLILDFATPPRG